MTCLEIAMVALSSPVAAIDRLETRIAFSYRSFTFSSAVGLRGGIAYPRQLGRIYCTGPGGFPAGRTRANGKSWPGGCWYC